MPATPRGFGRDEVNEFHDKVPYQTGFAICGKGEYGNGYYKKRYKAYELSLKNLSHCLVAQLRHQTQNFGYHSKDGWVYLDAVCHFVTRGGMANPAVRSTTGLAENCYRYHEMPVNINPTHRFRSGLPVGFVLTPHMIYDMMALDQASGPQSRFQLMRRIGSV